MSKRFLWLANKTQPTLVKSASFDVREGLVRIQSANIVGADQITFDLRVSNQDGPAIWTPYSDMDGRPVTLTAGRPRYVFLIAGTYRINTTDTENSEELVVTLIEDDLAGDNKVQYNWNNNTGVSMKDPAGSGSWVYSREGNGLPVGPTWVNQTYNELTGLLETTYHAFPGSPQLPFPLSDIRQAEPERVFTNFVQFFDVSQTVSISAEGIGTLVINNTFTGARVLDVEWIGGALPLNANTNIRVELRDINFSWASHYIVYAGQKVTKASLDNTPQRWSRRLSGAAFLANVFFVTDLAVAADYEVVIRFSILKSSDDTQYLP